jgi:hypothetical protein
MQELRQGNAKNEQYGRIAATSFEKYHHCPLLSSPVVVLQSLIALIVMIAQHTSHNEFRSHDVGQGTTITWVVT